MTLGCLRTDLFELLEDLAVRALGDLVLEDCELVLLEVELLLELLVLPGDFPDRLQLGADLPEQRG